MNLHGCYKHNNIIVKYIDNVLTIHQAHFCQYYDVHIVPNYIQTNDTFRTANRVVVDYSYCASLLCLYCSCSSLSCWHLLLCLHIVTVQIQPEYGDEQADAGRDCRTRVARPNSPALTRTGKY